MKIRKVYIDRTVADFPETEEICRRIGGPVEYIWDAQNVFRHINAYKDPITAGKHFLLLTRNRGDFIRTCPGTTHYTCCNYQILHIGSFCSMDCAYCILQAYFHPPLLTFFVNHTDMNNALQNLFLSSGMYRVGTGEFTDSLIWEDLYPLAPELIRKFAGRNNAVLEIKTKTSSVDHLLGLEHQYNTIMSWSLNTQRVIKTQERGTAALEKRIKAAAACQENGYPVAFHFDPMIWYEGCEADYDQVVEALFRRIDPAGIVWISLGSFRFMPQLNEIIEKRFPRSRIVHGEFIRGLDGKMRYFKPLRIRMYQSIVDKLRRFAPDVTLYFCMEDDEVWGRVLGHVPSDYGGLPKILDKSAIRHCRLA
ncbi:MAG: DNA photolyase [Desulfosalsimonadaceae bacterium]